MTVLLIILVVVGVALVAFYVSFPANTFMIFDRSNGGTITVGRTGVRVDPPPDRYPSNGFDHIGEYMAKLLSPSKGFKSAIIATEAGDRGCTVWSRDGSAEVALSVEWRDEPEGEARIRSFFAARNIAPSQDYLSDNGGVTGATRNLTYPLSGNVTEITRAAQVILEELCGISRTDSLSIRYREG